MSNREMRSTPSPDTHPPVDDHPTPESNIAGVEKGEKVDKKRRLLLATIATLAGGALLSLGDKPCSKDLKARTSEKGCDPREKRHPDIDEKGNFTDQAKKERTEVLAPGVEVFRDFNNLTFYIVRKGDNLWSIRRKLSQLDEFKYLATDSDIKERSFNIESKYLVPGMYLPIPLDQKERQMEDDEMISAAKEAIKEMKNDRVYGQIILKLMDEVSEKKFLAFILSIAKQESGDPIGVFSLHRFEPPNKYRDNGCFSFSYFHILMFGDGSKARQNLGLTEGMTYDPKNAVQLLLAYLIEMFGDQGIIKKLPNLMEFDDLDKAEDFATKYNGPAWRKMNPKYAKQIRRYYKQALAEID